MAPYVSGETESYKGFSSLITARGLFVITPEILALMKPSARILHPLPHVEEIALPPAVESEDPRIAYFR